VSGRFEAPKGTFDHLPPASGARAEVERLMLEQARLAGYQPIETPIFEDTAVFARGVGRPPTSSRRRCTPSPTRAAAP
jgi:histidyl-tRNA synthetase